MEQNALSKQAFGLQSKNPNIASTRKKNEPRFKLSSSKGVKYVEGANTYHVFLMERIDKADSYYYNLVVHENHGELEKYLYKYPLDLTENVTITKIEDNNITNKTNTVSSKTSSNCSTKEIYRVYPCPCVGHVDPLILYCAQPPLWIYSHSIVTCTNPEPVNPPIEEPDNNEDTGGFFVISPIDPLAPTPNSDPPLPTLEPDLDESITSVLELTNLQKYWLEKIENQWAKIKIENYLKKHTFSTEFNIAKLFAQQAIVAWIKNKDSEVDFVNKIIYSHAFMKTKAYCVIKLLTSSNNNLFADVTSQFTNNKAKSRLIFDYVSLTDKYGTLDKTTDANTSPPDPLGGITIRFNSNTNSANDNSLNIAATILHESIHAELFRIVNGNNNVP